MSEDPVAGPLSGIRVVESASFMTGPLAAVTLADLGAEVIKVESPGGDGFRGFGHHHGGWSALWSTLNRGKRSIELDLKADADQAVMKQLLARADVWIENWRPQVAERIGLADVVVRAGNPRLVHVSITGYGASGPMAEAPAYDSLIQAGSGMLDLAPPGRAPEVAPYWIVDKVVASAAAQAVLAALVQRGRTGQGSFVSLPMLDTMSYFNFPDLFQHRTYVDDTTPWAPAFQPVVPTADGHIVVTPASGAQISRTLKALGRDDVKAELRAIKDPVAMIDRFYRRLAEILVTETTAYWLERFAPFDLPVAAVRKLEDHLSDPQVVHNAIYSEFDSDGGRMRAPRYPARFDGTALRPAGRPPKVGEHAERIRAEWLAAERSPADGARR